MSVNRVKVLHVHTLPVISGSGINTCLNIYSTPNDLFEVSLACAPGGGLNDAVRDAGMRVYEVPNLVQPLHPWKDLLALFEIIRILRVQEIDVVHTHNSKAGFLGRLAGRLARTPVVIHTVHGFAFHAAEPLWRRILFRGLERLSAGWADHLIFISQPMIDWAQKEKILGQSGYSKIYSGVDLSAFCRRPKRELQELRRALGLTESHRVIGFVSKLWEGKGHEVALEAMAQVVRAVPGARMVMVGEGPIEQRLRDRSRELGIERSIVFAGFRRDIPEITSIFDLAILPSFFEGMGRVLIEAGACGKPVVASDVGGIPDVVEDGVTGILVPPGDPHALAQAMIRVLEEPELRRRMGRAARKRMDERFDAGTMVEEVVKLYRFYLNGKRIFVNKKAAPEPLPAPARPRQKVV